MPTTRLLVATIAMALPLQACAEEPPSVTRVAWLDQCPSEPEQPGLQAFSGFGAAIIAAVGPKLVDGAIDAAAGALKAAGESKAESTSARAFYSFYTVNQMADLVPNPDLGCVVVVRGRFASGASHASFPWADKAETLKGLQSIDFRFEARMQAVSGLKSFQLVPILAQLQRVQKRPWWAFGARQTRDYNVSLALQVPGAASPFASVSFTITALEEGQSASFDDWRLAQQVSEPMAFPAAPADVEAVRAKREKTVAPLLAAVDILTPRPATDPAPSLFVKEPQVMEALEAYCSAQVKFNTLLPEAARQLDARCGQQYGLEQRRDALDQALQTALRTPKDKGGSGRSIEWAERVCDPKVRPPRNGPETDCKGFKSDPTLAAAKFSKFTTRLTLVETREGSRFLAFLGTALGAAKADLSKAISDRVVPAVKNPAADEATSRAAGRAVGLADLDVLRAEQVLAEALEAKKSASEVTTARVALLKAKTAANDAYRNAGQPVPFPEVD